MRKLLLFCCIMLSPIFLSACAEKNSVSSELPKFKQESIESGQSQSTQPITLKVYLEAVYADANVHYPIYEKLIDFDESHPEIQLEFVSPVSGVTDPGKREIQINQLNTEIITGGGPDVFVMDGFRFTDVNLFPDIEKSMQNHSFLDLTEYAEFYGFQRDQYYPTLFETGQYAGAQYILPLSFSVPMFVAAESQIEQSGFQTDISSVDQTAFFDELSRVLESTGKQVCFSLNLSHFLHQPLINYKKGSVELDNEIVRKALTIEKDYLSNQLVFFDIFDAEQGEMLATGTPFASLEPSSGALVILHALDTKQIPSYLQGIPNEIGKITAEISSYAMANANTKYPKECAELLYYLLSAECQDAAAYPSTSEGFPVRKDSFHQSLASKHFFMVYGASHESMSEEDISRREQTYGQPLTNDTIRRLQTICEQISAAHFHTIWYNAMQIGTDSSGDNFITSTYNEYISGEISLDEMIDTLTPRLQMYLDE